MKTSTLIILFCLSFQISFSQDTTQTWDSTEYKLAQEEVLKAQAELEAILNPKPDTLTKLDTTQCKKLAIKYFKALRKKRKRQIKKCFISKKDLKQINSGGFESMGSFIGGIALRAIWEEENSNHINISYILEEKLQLSINNDTISQIELLPSHSPFENILMANLIVTSTQDTGFNKVKIPVIKINGKWKVSGDDLILNHKRLLNYQIRKYQKAGINFEEQVEKIDSFTNSGAFDKALELCEALLKIDPDESIIGSRETWIQRKKQLTTHK